MSNFVKNEEENYQTEIRGMIDDLVELADEADGYGLIAFEIDFIESIQKKLSYPEINLSPKQHECLFSVWEKHCA